MFCVGLIVLAGAGPTFALDPRDIVFECPCSAVWSGGRTSEVGELTLSFGVRSLRSTDSGDVEIRLGGEESSIGPIAAETVLAAQSRTVSFRQPGTGAIRIGLYETLGEAPDSSMEVSRLHEFLTLWPVPGSNGDRIEFVDILADADGDGFGDFNERLVGTSDTNSASNPGDSVIDVVALYNDGFRRAFGGYPQTRIHHVMTLTNAFYVDSGTNIRLRTVGMSEVALTAEGLPEVTERTRLMDIHGADLAFRFHVDGLMGCPGISAGCATLVGTLQRGHWQGNRARVSVCHGLAHATCAAHEIGHNLGLAHTALQGEAKGTFRWSRGHYLDWSKSGLSNRSIGTIMSYGREILGGVFSNPLTHCALGPCGVPIDQTGGANSVLSLDLVRHQVAEHRAPKRDTDGDGIVDVADALPHDPAEHVDSDGDGIGDLGDPDDDNDGVADQDDAFPLDPSEWADADDDGVGDNADKDIVNLSPFRDAALRAAVEEALGKSPGARITGEDLATLTELSAPARGIRDLTGLELAAGLEKLNIPINEVADLSPLADLKRLRDLRAYYNAVAVLTPLQGLTELEVLWITGNAVSDLAPLEGVTSLRTLTLSGNPVADISPLAKLHRLETLNLGASGQVISDLSPLAGLTHLRRLDVDGAGITDLSFVQELTGLIGLGVSNNPLSDLSPLSSMTRLSTLKLDGTQVDDLSPLSDLGLQYLDVSDTRVSLEDVAALPYSNELGVVIMNRLGIGDTSALSKFGSVRQLILRDNEVSDLAPLRGLSKLRSLWLGGNEVSDIRALAELPSLRSLNLRDNNVSDVGALNVLTNLDNLDLAGNDVSDIAPLVRREIWNLNSSPWIGLGDNPLNRESIQEHVATLESWGVRVLRAPSVAAVAVPDPALRAVIGQALAGGSVHVGDVITEASIKRLRGLPAFNAGILDLTGLEAATNLRTAWLGSNRISDVSPVAVLHELVGLDLGNNRIFDLAPLLDNPAMDAGDWITLSGNPLSEKSLNTHVPSLLDRDVRVRLDSVRLVARIDRDTVAFDTSGYFRALLANIASFTAHSSNTDVATVQTTDGVLRVTPVRHGTATVRVNARAADNTRATLVFLVTFRHGPRPVATAALEPEIGAEGASDRVELSRWFVNDNGEPLTFTASSSDPGLLRVSVNGGVLVVTSSDDGREGTATVTVTATDAYGLSATIAVEVSVSALVRGFLRGWRRGWLEQHRARGNASAEG